MLLEDGADINAHPRGQGRRTCLFKACRSRRLDHRLIGHLLAKGADAQGLDALKSLLQRPPPTPSSRTGERACQAYSAERLVVAKMLLERGAPIVDDQRASPVALVLRWVGMTCSDLARTEEAAVNMLDLLSAHGHTIHVRALLVSRSSLDWRDHNHDHELTNTPTSERNCRGSGRPRWAQLTSHHTPLGRHARPRGSVGRRGSPRCRSLGSAL
jgi:hypothetical protein